MKAESAWSWLIATTSLTVCLATATAYGQGACCTFSSCEPAGNEAECSSLGGVFLPGADCADDPCAEGACCFKDSCAITDAFSCITAVRDFGGAGTDCIDDPCESGVGACCNQGACDDASPEECDASGGSWLGAGTDCASGICDIGGCCTPGDCSDLAEFECNDLGGAFNGDADCAEGACLVEQECPLDSLFTQPRMAPGSFPILVSEASEDVGRFERFAGVGGAVDGLKWFGFELEIFNDGTYGLCEESTPQFEISFHDNVAGEPGPAVCSEIVTATRTVTEIEYLEGFFLIEYDADLAEACPRTEGWVSIVGLGDTDCSFVWVASFEGDGSSYCDTCETTSEPSDLNVCLLGTAGGIFGACCDETVGQCTDGVEIDDCTAVGLRFEADTACADLDVECGVVTGACCRSDGPCTTELEVDCLDLGGTWLGADSVCEQCPTVGACCVDFETCLLLLESECLKEDRAWMGPGSFCTDCPEVPECPVDSLVDQMPDDPNGFEAGTSEVSTVFRRYENVSAVAGAIDGLTWWGLDMVVPAGQKHFEECIESDNTFEITFHADAGGVPGDAVCSYTLPVTHTETGWRYNGADLNKYEVSLPDSCVMVNGWVSVAGLGDPDCWFLWMSAGPGESYCDGCIPSEVGVDLNVCLQGAQGGVFGACCDDETGDCTGAKVPIGDCLETTQRFLADATCDDFDPPCGVVLGACCSDDGSCNVIEQAECDVIGGTWQGANSLCSQCPCITSCPGGSVPEGELECSDDFVDTVNGGCDTDPPVFAPIVPCEPICGTSGWYEVGGAGTAFEFDYFEFEIDDPETLNFSVEAEFPVIAAILDGTIGCPGEVMALEIGSECEPVTASAFLGQGIYWLVVTPASFSDLAQCGAGYTATLTLGSACPADLDGDGDVDPFDFAAFQACFTGPEGGPVPVGCESVDFDLDDDVDLTDWGAFQRAYTGP